MKCAKPKFPDSWTKNLKQNFCPTASCGSFHIWHLNWILVFPETEIIPHIKIAEAPKITLQTDTSSEMQQVWKFGLRSCNSWWSSITVSADVLLCSSVENQKKKNKQFGTFFFFCYHVSWDQFLIILLHKIRSIAINHCVLVLSFFYMADSNRIIRENGTHHVIWLSNLNAKWIGVF
jgi:hypothetical protein